MLIQTRELAQSLLDVSDVCCYCAMVLLSLKPLFRQASGDEPQPGAPLKLKSGGVEGAHESVRRLAGNNGGLHACICWQQCDDLWYITALGV